MTNKIVNKLHSNNVINFLRKLPKFLPKFPKGKPVKIPEAVRVCGLTTLTVTMILLGLRQIGMLQSLELMAFDQMVRSRPDRDYDPRLLLVGITEEDIPYFKRWPLSDGQIADLLAKISAAKAEVIGLDIYRDIPFEPGGEKLAKELKSDKIIAIKNLGEDVSKSVNPPPNVPEERIGFNDIVFDYDGVVRRNLISVAPSADKTELSFAVKLAIKYLSRSGIVPESAANIPNGIKWGKGLFLPLNKNAGAYVLNDKEVKGYQILLDYRSPDRVARLITAKDILSGNFDPNLIKDKIVIIGTIAPSAKDFFLTPYSAARNVNSKMYGPIVHAQMLSQILDIVEGNKPLFNFWPEWAEVLWIGVWALIGANLAWNSRYPLLLFIGTPALLITLSGLTFWLFLDYKWVPFITPMLAFLLTDSAIIAHQSYQAQRQQKIVMKLLGQNTSPEVAQALWKNRDQLIEDGKLPGQKLIATMLFTDIKDFSTISEQMPPEKLMEWLNEYLGSLAEAVQANYGIVNKFTGDGIMAGFGVPIARTTEKEIGIDAKNAVNCGMEMGERLLALNQDWQKRGLPVVQMRVGIFTGRIVAGSLGGKNRLEYGLLGDSVNIASRLESCEKDRQSSLCRVLIAHQTFVYIKDDFIFEEWGPIALKGKQQTVDVYRVISRKKVNV